MTENLLVTALARHLRTELHAFLLDDARGGEAAVSVHEGWLPAKHGEDNGDFPFVVVRPVEGSIGREGSQTTVELICGVYDMESTGWKTAVNVARRAMNALLLLPSGMLERRWMLAMPLEWKVAEEQPYPAWMVSVTTAWTARTPETLPADMEHI